MRPCAPWCAALLLQQAGLTPAAAGPATATTTGLKWDLHATRLVMGGMVRQQPVSGCRCPTAPLSPTHVGKHL